MMALYTSKSIARDSRGAFIDGSSSSSSGTFRIKFRTVPQAMSRWQHTLCLMEISQFPVDNAKGVMSNDFSLHSISCLRGVTLIGLIMVRCFFDTGIGI